MTNLAGNGMLLANELLRARPWEAFTSAEDLEYSLELNMASIRIAFAGGAVLLSPPAPNPQAAAQQQLRWEGGKALLARTWIPRLIMAALRDRQSGCPWDVEQTFATIAPYTIEEAYERALASGLREGLIELFDFDHCAIPTPPRPYRSFGNASAASTNAAVASLRSIGFSPARRARAIRLRKMIAPTATIVIVSPNPLRLKRNVSPRITAAIPATRVPTPMLTSANPCC